MKVFTMIAALSLITTPALGQVVSGEGENAGVDGTAVVGVKDQPANVVNTFGGIRVQVERLLRVPSTDTLRLILSVTETVTSKKSGRLLAFISPPATLIDDVGNSYYAQAVRGVAVCRGSNGNWQTLYYCSSESPTFLTPSVPVRVMVGFEPWPEHFSPELASLATTAMLSARIGLFEGNSKVYRDVVINNIELP